MKLDTIWQYPVKSMIGGTVESAELDEVGIVGDRTWAVRDEDAGVIANTRKLGGLMRFAARYGDGGSVTITLPGARTCLLYTSPSPRDRTRSRMPSSA